MHRSKHRTNRFARRIVTLLAHHWLIRRHLDIWKTSLPKAFDANPLDGTTITGVHFADEWDVVLHRAGSHTSLTAGAQILIDHHSPNIRRHNFVVLRYRSLHFISHKSLLLRIKPINPKNTFHPG